MLGKYVIVVTWDLPDVYVWSLRATDFNLINLGLINAPSTTASEHHLLWLS